MTKDLALQQEIEQFLYGEAALLEQGSFEDWLGLLTDDIEYWIPNRIDNGNRNEQAMISFEDRTALRARAVRMTHPRNPTQMPPPRTKYFITNVMVGEFAGDELAVTASVLLTVVVPRREMAQHPITSEYRLRRVEGDWKICKKKVYLIANDQPLPQLPLI